MMECKSKYKISPAEKKRMIDKAEFALFQMGLTQKEVAGELGISQNAMNRWVKALGWKEKISRLSRAEEAQKLKCTENLPGFVLYVKKNHPEQYAAIETLYKEFTKRY